MAAPLVALLVVIGIAVLLLVVLFAFVVAAGAAPGVARQTRGPQTTPKTGGGFFPGGGK